MKSSSVKGDKMEYTVTNIDSFEIIPALLVIKATGTDNTDLSHLYKKGTEKTLDNIEVGEKFYADFVEGINHYSLTTLIDANGETCGDILNVTSKETT